MGNADRGNFRTPIKPFTLEDRKRSPSSSDRGSPGEEEGSERVKILLRTHPILEPVP